MSAVYFDFSKSIETQYTSRKIDKIYPGYVDYKVRGKVGV